MTYDEILLKSIEEFNEVYNDNKETELFTLENLNHWKYKYLTQIRYFDQVIITNRTKLEPYVQLAELSLVNHINNCNYLVQRFKSNKPWQWDKRFSNTPTDLSVILMYKTLSENFTSALVLLINGYEYQAKIIFRGYVELSALLFTFLLDSNFAHNYLIGPNDQKDYQTHWFKYLKPEKVQSKLRSLKQAAEKELKNTSSNKQKITDDNILNVFLNLRSSVVIDFQFTHSDFRDRLYNVYSDYTHFSSQLLSHHFYDKNKKGFRIGIGNNISDQYNQTLVNFIEYSCYVNSSILMAINYHSLSFPDNEVKGILHFIDHVTFLTCINATFQGLYEFGENK